MRHHATSLASATPGTAVTVREILFEGLRAYCGKRGLHDGGKITLLDADSREVLLRNTSGTMVRCPAAFARFIEVTSEEGAIHHSRHPRPRRARRPRVEGG
jgi:hypothetical protein